jgi:hypothetical protein
VDEREIELTYIDAAFLSVASIQCSSNGIPTASYDLKFLYGIQGIYSEIYSRFASGAEPIEGSPNLQPETRTTFREG